MKLVLTKHAHQRMDFHGITAEHIRMAIQRGAKTPQTDGFLARHTYVCVAYKVQGEKYIVKTVFVER